MPINRLQAFRENEDGAVAVIVALLLTVLLGFVAMGVDMASLYRARAQLQSISDLTALSAMSNTDEATNRATQTLLRNDTPAEALAMLQTGRFYRNPDIAANQRFEVLSEGDTRINAVRIVLEKDAPLHFAQIFTDDTTVMLDRTSISTRTGGASFSLNSHLVTLDNATLNELLARNFGIDATLSVNDVSVLGDAALNLGALLGALNAPLSRNPAEVLNTTTSIGGLIAAAQSILPSSVGSRLDGLTNSNATFTISSLIGGIDTELGITATDFLAEIDITALELISAILAAETGGGGVTLNAPISVAGILNVDTTLTAGEPPAQSGWIALGENGVQLHRAGVRLKSDISASTGLLGNFAAGLQITKIHLPIYTELAGSTASLDQIGCNISAPQDVAARFSTSATPLHPANGTSVAALYLGTLPDTAGPINPADLGFADLLEVNIVIPLLLLPDIEIAGLTIQARSHVSVGASQTDTITFTQADVSAGTTTQTFGSGDLLSTAIGDLLSPANTEFRVKPDQEGLVTGAAQSLVAGLLNALPDRLLTSLAAPVDGVLDETLSAAGLEIGAGELTLTGHHCEPIRLAR